MRAEIVRGNSQESDPYAIVKELTRGQAVDAEALASFVEGLDISEAAKKSLDRDLPPSTTWGWPPRSLTTSTET
jgi:adenylosuccinate lyase